MFEKSVFDDLERAAATYGEYPVDLGIGCMDPRVNPVMIALMRKYPGLFNVRNLGAYVAPYDGPTCDAAAALDLLIRRGLTVETLKLRTIFYVAHEDCAYCKAARTPELLAGTEAFPRLLRLRGPVAGTDLDHAKTQRGHMLSHPNVLEGYPELVCLFVTKKGRLKQYNPQTRTYETIQAA